ncbi:MAG: AmmeMemoRadiSam system protein A [Spirochaetales bacterium]|nr:AmmeMemoRadiSam system protein A [Spirochaetales bacterium]
MTRLKKANRILLLKLARESIAEHLVGTLSVTYRELTQNQVPEDFLTENGVFVTLKKKDSIPEELALRGCIGNILGKYPLYESIRRLAVEAAVEDPRFQPVNSIEELGSLIIEISILTIPKQIVSYKEIVVGRDGILLHCQGHTAVFLPQVAVEQEWSLEETLTHLSLKAGLGVKAWKDPYCQFHVFQAEILSELDSQ